jgi:hypothetical protein
VGHTLTQVATRATLFRVLRLIFFQAVYTCLTALGPFILLLSLYRIGNSAKTAPIFIGLVLGFVELLNLTTVLISTIPLIALLTVLLHHLFWPAASKLVYPLARYRAISNRTRLFFARPQATAATLRVCQPRSENANP